MAALNEPPSVHIAYYDESGDDGYPRFSSPVFALAACYVHHLNWKGAFEAIHEFRRALRLQHGIPVKWEIHTKHLLLGKRPYRGLALTDATRVAIVEEFCDLIAQLDLKVVNVAIVKPRILFAGYPVLDTAFKYSIQRIENDLAQNPTNRFLIISDEGRLGAMRGTARRIQRINFIPSKFGATPYRREIRALIEDPLPKNSKESYFIQLCDLVAFVVYLHVLATTGSGTFHARLPAHVTPALVDSWLERMKPSLNLAAAPEHPFGIKIHPS